MRKRKLHLHRETLKPLTTLDTTNGGRPETRATFCFTCPCPPSIFTDCDFGP